MDCDLKRNPEMGETAVQPVPAQTANLSISGLRFMSSPCSLQTLFSGSISKSKARQIVIG